MKDTSRSIEGTVLKLQCTACRSEFCVFVFSGENDVATWGLVSASVCNMAQTVVIEALPEEWNDFDGSGISLLENRLSRDLGHANARVARFLRSESMTPPAAGMAFQEFRKAYVPPKLIYACICCGDGEAAPIETATVDSFERSGGRIVTTGRLVLAR